ncbi:AMP-binding protein, partial [Mycetohabitans sp. B5]
DGSDVSESHRMLPPALNDRLRAHAKRLGVSLASLCHLAWAQVLARASGQQRVVFGTVLFGRMQAGEGADRAMGLFINTLPLRVDLDGSVQAAVHVTHARLAALLEHEHASLALAQRCSGVPAGTPLFSALLNYRHNAMDSSERSGLPGVELLSARERTNYPLILSVDDDGQSLRLTAQVVSSLEPERVCAYMQQALHSLADALEAMPDTAVQQLQVLPEAERQLLLQTWNATAAPYPDQCLHQLFEAQVKRTPEAPALVFENQMFSYAQLNAQANRLAHQLIELGVEPDARVAICVERSPAMVVGLLAIMKAGGACVPLDPAYPCERLAHILHDAAPTIVLADATGRATLGEEALACRTVLEPDVALDQVATNPRVAELTPRHLAYVIYTSGSTGTSKGVMIEHGQIARLFEGTKPNGTLSEDQALIDRPRGYSLTPADRVLQKTSFNFDISIWELFGTLLNGATLIVADADIHKDPVALKDLIVHERITTVYFVPSILSIFLDTEGVQRCTSVKHLICSGEALSGATSQRCQTLLPDAQVHNLYGPTENALGTTFWTCPVACVEDNIPIGRPIANTRVYLLDAHGQPVPLGAVGELYIGGAGVA